MQKVKIAAIIITVFFLFPVNARAGNSGKGQFTKHFNESLFAVSENNEFSIEILPDEKEYKIGKDVIGVVIHNRHNEDVEGADIKITYEGMTEQPVIKEKGDGLYTASKINLVRDGKWELRITIKRKKILDSAIFAFPDAFKKLLPAGGYTKESLIQ